VACWCARLSFDGCVSVGHHQPSLRHNQARLHGLQQRARHLEPLLCEFGFVVYHICLHFHLFTGHVGAVLGRAGTCDASEPNVQARYEYMWTVKCPLICFYAVEIHLPHRVACQFGLEQSWPAEEVSTNIELHKYVYTHESCPSLHILHDAYNRKSCPSLQVQSGQAKEGDELCSPSSQHGGLVAAPR
jgi:hypothetical protein